MPKTGGMVKRMSILARGVAAEKQGPLLNSLTNHDSKISIRESEFWLIFTAKHWQTGGPALRLRPIQQVLVDGINAPWPPSTRAEHHQGVQDVEKVLSLFSSGAHH